MIVLLVSGGRAYNDRKSLFRELDRIHAEKNIECVMHGACPNRKDSKTGEIIWSADMLAEEWAKSHEICYFGVPAEWNTGKIGGKAEGPLRNQKMVDLRPHYAVIFPGSAGSADMLRRVIDGAIPHEVIK